MAVDDIIDEAISIARELGANYQSGLDCRLNRCSSLLHLFGDQMTRLNCVAPSHVWLVARHCDLVCEVGEGFREATETCWIRRPSKYHSPTEVCYAPESDRCHSRRVWTLTDPLIRVRIIKFRHVNLLVGMSGSQGGKVMKNSLETPAIHHVRVPTHIACLSSRSRMHLQLLSRRTDRV